MKELLIPMGHLLALKQLNRDHVAESLGMTRQNLIASLKGRRPLPKQYLPQLTKLLCLDDKYLLKIDHVHVLSISNATKQYDACYNVMHTFLHSPLKQIALLHGIGENKQTLAYVLQDKRGAFVLLRNDEKTLAYLESHDSNTANSKNNTNTPPSGLDNVHTSNSHKLFDHASYQYEREITVTHFERIMREGVAVEELESILKQDAKVWTWARLCEKAESLGMSPDDIVKTCKLDR